MDGTDASLGCALALSRRVFLNDLKVLHVLACICFATPNWRITNICDLLGMFSESHMSVFVIGFRGESVLPVQRIAYRLDQNLYIYT
jgi:hypothetical protein